MAYVMMTVKAWKQDKMADCTADDFRGHFNVVAHDFDEEYGLVRLTSPEKSAKFCMMIDLKVAEGLKREYPNLFEGPWNNPRIAPEPRF